MTLPLERSLSVVRAREFLIRLTSPYGGGIKGVRKEIRSQARDILRHYPSLFDLKQVSEQCPDVFSVTGLGGEHVDIDA